MEQQQPMVSHSIDLNIARELEDKEFRDQFFRTQLALDIPTQIKALRKFRGLNQGELASLIGTKQSAISRLEKSDDPVWKFETLLSLAEALNARLVVAFEPYESVIARYRSEQSTAGSSAATAHTEENQRQRASAANELRSTQSRETRPRREPALVGEEHGISRD